MAVEVGVLLLFHPLTLLPVIHQLHQSFGQAPNRVYVPTSPHHDGKQFLNPVTTEMMDFGKLPSVMRRRLQGNVEKVPHASYRFTERGRERLPDSNQLHVNWLGHATLLIHSRGRYFLTDPVLSQRASPFEWLGPQRFFPAPIAAQALPPIEALILSHDHYDHLDYRTLMAIKDRVERFVVPLGVGSHLRQWGVAASLIRELDWGEKTDGSGYSITALPARHFSGRGLARNYTFWASYSLYIDGHHLYFGGDSGIFPGYQDIGKQYGPFELAFIPIGAYDEAWKDIHLNPEEGLDACKEVRGERMFPMHWGTFDLALHSWYDPIERLHAAADGISLMSPPPGQWVTTQDEPAPDWWQSHRRQ